PPPSFQAQARISSMEEYHRLYERSIRDPDGFWLEMARGLFWFRFPTQGLNASNPPFFKWFEDGTTNISVNCLDRHLEGPRRHKAAIIFEGEPGDVRVLTYAQLHREVCKMAHALRLLGVEAGDRVAIYMGMVPEAIIGMLACARIGAVHTVVFGGFAPEALRDRINDAQAKVLLTQDGAWRRGNLIPLKANADRILGETPSVRHVVVYRRIGNEISMIPGRDHDWHALVEAQPRHFEAPELPAEHPLFILYTSGTTGKPKGVLHTTGGYMVGAYLTTRYVFDINDADIYWCTADIGWVTGHSYVCLLYTS
ncbi:MAG: AMP-binding protein, partial [Deltaproteobacteria bacterium]|nr:AMP-binding protein [Deltaproteobacteria bacterium]